MNSNSSQNRRIPLPNKFRGVVAQNRLSSYFLVEIASISDRIFDERKGEILGNPYIRFSRSQHTSGQIILDDNDDSIRKQINEADKITIKVGFTSEYEETVFVGSIKKIGRRLPSATIIEFVDSSYTSNSQSPAVVSSRGEGAVPDAPTVDLTNFEGTDLLSSIREYSSLNEQTINYQQSLTQLVPNLELENSSQIVVHKQGEVLVGETALDLASREASLLGESLTVEGDRIIKVNPATASSTGIVVDYSVNRAAFVGTPTVTRRAPNQLAGGSGAWTVRGWDINSKTNISATVVIPDREDFDPDRTIVILGRTFRLGDPITPGNLFTWGLATKGGTRIPPNATVVSNIQAIAIIADRLNRQYSKTRWTVTSWYRDPVSNRRAGGVSNSRHLVGDAIDVAFPEMEQVFRELESTYPGGLARKRGSFLHLDNRQNPARWNY